MVFVGKGNFENINFSRNLSTSIGELNFNAKFEIAGDYCDEGSNVEEIFIKFKMFISYLV